MATALRAQLHHTTSRDGTTIGYWSSAGYRELLQLSDEEIEQLKSRPEWSARLASAHTMPRELKTVDWLEFDENLLRRVSAPTLLLVGEEGPDWQPERVAAVLPDARIAVLAGQAHGADLFAPVVVADALLAFLQQAD